MMNRKAKTQTVSFLECLKIWWRFCISFLGILLICSLLTHVLLLGGVWLTQLLNLSDSAPKSLVHVNNFGMVNSAILHIVGASSLFFFIILQIIAFYVLLNYSTAIRKILYKSPKPNSYFSHAIHETLNAPAQVMTFKDQKKL